MTESKFVAYLRQASRPRLDVAEQRAAVAAYIAENGGRIVAEVIEVESVRATARPAFEEALAQCRVYRAGLVIPRFAKLLHDARIVSALQHDVAFVALDAPEVVRFTVSVLAQAAICRKAAASERIKAGLQDARARGVRVGNPKGVGNCITEGDRAKASEARSTAARMRAGRLRAVLDDLRAGGGVTAADLADALNLRGVPTLRGGSWGPEQVKRTLARLDMAP